MNMNWKNDVLRINENETKKMWNKQEKINITTLPIPAISGKQNIADILYVHVFHYFHQLQARFNQNLFL